MARTERASKPAWAMGDDLAGDGYGARNNIIFDAAACPVLLWTKDFTARPPKVLRDLSLPLPSAEGRKTSAIGIPLWARNLLPCLIQLHAELPQGPIVANRSGTLNSHWYNFRGVGHHRLQREHYNFPPSRGIFAPVI
jgi:hypothetical protein